MRIALAPRLLGLVVSLFVLTTASSALAQSASGPPTPAARVRGRVDIELPGFGVAITSNDGPALSFAHVIRYAHASGPGFRIAGALATTDAGVHILSSNAYSQLVSADLAYLHRFRLVGDDRVGLGLDVFGGTAWAFVDDHEATSWCVSTCPPPTPRPFGNPNGHYLGGVVGGSIDVRAHGFLIGFDVRYAGLLAIATAPGRADLQTFAAGVHLGFSI
jgi:hypothetical protein